MASHIFNSLVRSLQVMGVLICATTALSMVLTRLLIWLLPKWGMIDKPDFKRRIHTKAVPRGGGLGMLVAFAAVSAAFFGLTAVGGDAKSWDMLKLLAPLAILLPLGVMDDRRGLRARTKFIFQALAALLAWSLGFRMGGCLGMRFPVWLGLPLTLFWIVAFINAFNMIDGVDGLAAGVGVISALCMGTTALTLHHYRLAILLAVFTAALLGFLYYNWHPARLFMGDTGSMFLGYLLAVAGLRLNAQTVSVASIGIPLLACGIPVIDICLAVWRRIFRPSASPSGGQDAPEEAPSFFKRLAALAARLGTADQSHLHHRLLHHFHNNQRQTIYRIYLLSLCMGIVGIFCSLLPGNDLTLALAVILGTFSFIINRVATIELWNTTEALYCKFHSARTGIILSYVVNPLWDMASVACSYTIVAQGFPTGSHTALMRYVLILMAILYCSQSYRVLWNFAASDDYFRLARTLIFGFLLTYVVDLIFRVKGTFRLHLCAAGLAITFIFLERLFLHYFRNAQIRRHAAFSEEADNVLTVIVGVTPLARLYRNQLAYDLRRAEHEQIIGLVDQDHRFVHSYCYGMKVLGHFDNLEYLMENYHVGKIVLTQNLPEAEMQLIKDNCRKFNAVLTIFNYQEKTL